MATNDGSRVGPQLPQQFGRYHVQKRLGDGGMGSVYLVLNTDLQREEALKVPNFDAGDGAEMRERFIREARAAAALDHPNLCPVYNVGERDGVCYLTMRYLKGKLLSDYTGASQPPRKAVEIVTKLAQALAVAHAKGVTHRDLKPNNVMMCPGVGPVVMDFGLAKQAQQQDRKLTRMGSVLGTPAYMPPEQVKGDLTKLGPASDVYSLGVILFELLTGRLPFEGATDAEVYGKILYTAAPAASALRPGLSPALDVICRKALAKAPEDRYASMKALAADLIEYLKATPPTVGGGDMIVSKGGTANVFQMPTVAPGLSKPATAPPRSKRPTPPALGSKPPQPPRSKAPATATQRAGKAPSWIKYNCPSCKKPLESSASEAGFKKPCPACGQRIQIPAASAKPLQSNLNKTMLAGDANAPQPLGGQPGYSTRRVRGAAPAAESRNSLSRLFALGLKMLSFLGGRLPSRAASSGSPPDRLPPSDGGDGSSSDGGGNVECAVFAPAEVKPGENLFIQVFAYASGKDAEAMQRAREFDETTTRKGMAILEIFITGGQALQFHLSLHGVKVRKATRQLKWQGKTASVQFGVTIPSDRKAGNLLARIMHTLGQEPLVE